MSYLNHMLLMSSDVMQTMATLTKVIRHGLVNRQLKQLSFLHSNRHAGSKLQGRSPKGTECFSGLTFTACNAHQIDLDRFDDLILSSS